MGRTVLTSEEKIVVNDADLNSVEDSRAPNDYDQDDWACQPEFKGDLRLWQSLLGPNILDLIIPRV